MIKSKLQGKSVLVVDDEVELRKALTIDFIRRGCLLYEASNGRDALAIVKTKKIDLVVSDIRMPDGDGFELLKQIRLFHPSIPVVMLLTGFSEIDENTALKEGAYALLAKPIDRKPFLALLEKCLD